MLYFETKELNKATLGETFKGMDYPFLAGLSDPIEVNFKACFNVREKDFPRLRELAKKAYINSKHSYKGEILKLEKVLIKSNSKPTNEPTNEPPKETSPIEQEQVDEPLSEDDETLAIVENQNGKIIFTSDFQGYTFEIHKDIDGKEQVYNSNTEKYLKANAVQAKTIFKRYRLNVKGDE